MSHLHIPDGLLPAWLIVITWSAAILLLLPATRIVARDERPGGTALVAVMVTLMLLGASVPLFVYHLNLTVLAGILLGPVAGFIAAFLVNLVLALFGHGGLTVAGLNSLFMGLEPALGFLLFGFFLRLWGSSALRQAAAISVMLTLPLTGFLKLGAIALISRLPGTLLEGTDFHGLHFGGTYLVFALPGWVLEAVITALALGYIHRLRPGLVRPMSPS